MLRRRALLGGNLPPYVAELEYIESTGVQWIDTGVIPDSSTVLEVTGSFVSFNSDNINFGLIDSSSGTLNRFHFGVYFNKFIFGVGNSINNKYSRNTEYHNFTLGGSGVGKIDVTSVGTLQTLESTSLSIFLFARNANGTADTFCNFRLRLCKIYKNGVLVRDFIPVINKYGVCLYDKVTKTFFYNQGSGEFISGPIKEVYKYTETEYIESTGTQWIDTLYKPNGNTRVVCEMQHTGNTSYGRLFGCSGGTEWNSSPIFQVDYEEDVTGNLRYIIGNETSWNILSSVTGDYNRHTYDFSTTRFLRDGTQVATHSAVTFQCTTNLAIFSYMKSSGISTESNEFMIGRLYSFKIYESSELVRDFIPVSVGNVGYMYDKVTKQFFGNAGSGRFTLGPDKDFTYKDFVDLGLPSGMKWAIGNLVKDSQGNYTIGEETVRGTYISWGNIVGHNNGEGYNFNETTYNGTSGKSVSANIPSNDATHDAALALLGSPWHLPTKENFQELYDNTDREWTTINGVNGWKFMKKSDHSVFVFFPAAGSYSDSSVGGFNSLGYYLSSSYFDSSRAYRLHFDSSAVYPQNYGNRYYGFSVRAVQ